MDKDEFPLQAATTQKQYIEKLPKITLEMNSRAQVRVNPSSSISRTMTAEFLGVQHYEFMIFRLPSMPGMRNQLLPQTLVEIRFMSEGAVSTFITEVISHVVKPTFLLFTSYPDRLSIMEMRTCRRVVCALPVIINSSFGDATGLIRDLSTSGCRIVFDLTGQSSLRQLTVDAETVLQTSFSADGFPVGCNVVIRNLEMTGTVMSLGVSFTDPIKEFVDSITEYLDMVIGLSSQ